jgi:hypothetical protein
MIERVVAFIQKEGGVLRKAPFTFASLSVLFLDLGYGAGTLVYGERVDSLREQNAAKEGQLGRYRVALGIDPASKGALVELNNEELALKAQACVAKLRKLSTSLRLRNEAIQKQVGNGQTTQEQAFKLSLQADTEASDDFERSQASEAHNLLNELTRRLDSKATAHIVRVPGFIDSEGTRLPLTEILKGTGADTSFIPRLADEIEQMSELLPSSAKKP